MEFLLRLLLVSLGSKVELGRRNCYSMRGSVNGSVNVSVSVNVMLSLDFGWRSNESGFAMIGVDPVSFLGLE